MSHTYTVLSCTYDGTYPNNPNPLSLYQKAWMEQQQDHEPESMAAICQHVFKESIDKVRFAVDSMGYAEGSITEFWKRLGVTPIPLNPCKEGEEGFSWSEFVNDLGRRTQEKNRSTSS